jgi:hypothetical protein
MSSVLRGIVVAGVVAACGVLGFGATPAQAQGFGCGQGIRMGRSFGNAYRYGYGTGYGNGYGIGSPRAYRSFGPVGVMPGYGHHNRHHGGGHYGGRGIGYGGYGHRGHHGGRR